MDIQIAVPRLSVLSRIAGIEVILARLDAQDQLHAEFRSFASEKLVNVEAKATETNGRLRVAETDIRLLQQQNGREAGAAAEVRASHREVWAAVIGGAVVGVLSVGGGLAIHLLGG